MLTFSWPPKKSAALVVITKEEVIDGIEKVRVALKLRVA
jgi:hypothetical protein